MREYTIDDGLYNAPKPPFPYTLGQEFTVRSHVPPPPTDLDCLPDRAARREREEYNPLERCFIHPPAGSDGNQVVRFKISKAILLEDNHNAQLGIVDILHVAPCTAGGPQENTTILAKFYDPLYYNHVQDDVDPFLGAEYNYSHETAAYAALSELQGHAIPKYYGSFALELPVNGYKTKRFVTLILLELVQGVPMREIDPAGLPRAQRQQIMKGIIDADTAVYTHRILHGDVHPRNIIINNDPGSTRRVTLIDFDRAKAWPAPYILAEYAKLFYLPGPASPLLRWHRLQWDQFQRHFDGWIDWDWQAWLEENYVDAEDAITSEMREFWLPDDPEDILKLPGLKIW
ncbi:hypothetical protein FQN49_000453 [Arthroderma sp. PD_2]|nr:hypothetical protein FQN49_000453 [Arthroderma sp. PD_2]